MKKLIIFMFAAMTLGVSAQQAESVKGPRGQRPFAEMRQAKAQKGFNLSEENQKIFKALNEEYKKEREAIRKKYQNEKLEKDQKPTEKQMDARMENRMACRKALLDLQEKYYPKYRKVLTPQQTAQVLKMFDNAPRQKFNKAKQGRKFQGQRGQNFKRGQRGHAGKCCQCQVAKGGQRGKKVQHCQSAPRCQQR